MKALMSNRMQELLDEYTKRNRVKNKIKYIGIIENLLGKRIEDEFIKRIKNNYELAQHEYVECLEREMKIKSDYVTNSSSTSFCGWGIQIFDIIRENIPEKFLNAVYTEYLAHCTEHNIQIISLNEFCLRSLILNEDGERDDNYEINRWYFQFFKIIAEKYHLFCEIDSFGKEFVIGKSSFEIPDDMTARFYKEFIKSNLKKLDFNLEEFCEIFTIINQ